MKKLTENVLIKISQYEIMKDSYSSKLSLFYMRRDKS